MLLYLGLHQPADAKHFDRVCIAYRRLVTRRKPLGCRELLIDSNSFTEVSRHGGHRDDARTYARRIRSILDRQLAPVITVVPQDWMCEPWIVERTGLSVGEHQRLTIERFDELAGEALGVPILPVLQGFMPSDYAAHVRAYGRRLHPGAWVGLGSVCKRNGKPGEIAAVAAAVHVERPDLRLHGFGVKKIAMATPNVRGRLFSADSMAWSFHARKQGRNANDWREAERFAADVNRIAASTTSLWQGELLV